LKKKLAACSLQLVACEKEISCAHRLTGESRVGKAFQFKPLRTVRDGLPSYDSYAVVGLHLNIYPSRRFQTNNRIRRVAPNVNDYYPTVDRVVGVVTLGRRKLNFEHQQRRKKVAISDRLYRISVFKRQLL
jgi:hypothetical protein